jgi:hypothetical protein
LDSKITVAGSENWTIETDEGGVTDFKLGTLINSRGAFVIVPEIGSPLDGINAGPWLSKQEAMDAIAMHLHGECVLGV